MTHPSTLAGKGLRKRTCCYRRHFRRFKFPSVVRNAPLHFHLCWIDSAERSQVALPLSSAAVEKAGASSHTRWIWKRPEVRAALVGAGFHSLPETTRSMLILANSTAYVDQWGSLG